MKTLKAIITVMFIGLAMNSQAQIMKKSMPPRLAYQYFQDTIVVGYSNPVTVLNAGEGTVKVTVTECSVRPGDGTNKFVILAPASLAGQSREIVVTVTQNGTTKEVLRKSVVFLEGAPSLLNRMQ
jgi:hypothetical protein